MGFFEKIFVGSEEKKREKALRSSFSKIYQLMTDETRQNSMCPKPLRDKMTEGGKVDKVSGAFGEFGRDIRNPIPVNGPFGELIYISNLNLESGVGVIAHRLGSVDKKDVYELVALDGSRWDLLYFNMYYNRKSRLLPTGYIAAEEPARFLMAVNVYVSSFPGGFYEAMGETSKRIIGIPLVSPELRGEPSFAPIRRSPRHVGLIQSLNFESRLL